MIRKRVITPIRLISDSMKLFARNSKELPEPLAIRNDDEIGEIAFSFESMTEEITSSIQNIEALTRERVALNVQMDVARRIQNGLVPEKTVLNGASFAACAMTRPAKAVGNLMPRYSDGEFQINSVTNAFMRSLRAFAAMGKVSVSMLDQPVEFSPIDCTAASVVALSAEEGFTVFHATNSHLVQMGDVVESMNRCGIPVETVDEQEFENAFRAALSDDALSMIVSPLITYQASDRNTQEFNIGYDNAFTTKALYRLRVKWPIIGEKYLDQVFTSLATIGFFDLMTDEQ